MSTTFSHSVKVPRIYKIAASIVRQVREDGGSLKTLIFEKKHPNVSGICALTTTTLQKGPQLDRLLLTTRILINEPRLDQWLARVLITELLWGKGVLKSDAKPVQTVLTYEKELREELKCINQEVSHEQILKETLVQKPRYVRVNTLLLEVDKAISSFESEGWNFIPRCATYSSYLKTLKNLKESYFTQDFHIPELLAFPPKALFYDHPAYLNGQLVLQDKASCLPAFLLNPPPGSVVLDMCAAPGMKTTHLAAIMRNEGKIYATEIETKRYATLCELVKKMDCVCVKPMRIDALTLSEEQYADVEYILVDPSCSGSGMTDRLLMNDDFSTERLKRLQAFQVFLLRHALLNFPEVKRVTYSTCSINPDENEKVVDEILQNVNGAYNLVPAKDLLGENWINYSSTSYDCGDKCFYARPETDLTNGFFVAVFERNFDVPLPEYKRKSSRWERKQDQEGKENEVLEKGHAPPRKRKRRGKKKRKDTNGLEESQTAQADEPENHVVENTEPEQADEEEPKKKKKKRKSTHKEKPDQPESVQESIENNLEEAEADLQQNEVEKPKKKKKKSKDKERITQQGEMHMQVDEEHPIGTCDVENAENNTESDKQKKVRKKKKKEKVVEIDLTSDD